MTAVGETVSQVALMSKEKIKKCEEPEELREYLTTLLNSHQGRFFFFIDEIDRLGGDEILSLFRLIKLLSAFPKVNIVAAFDPSIVDAALSNFGGLAFAEKIFCWSYNLPPLNPLNNCLQFLTQLGVLSKGTELKLETRQLELLNILSPIFINGRKSKRLCSSVLFAQRRTNGALELFDLIAVEAIRLVSPAALEAVLAELTQFQRKAVDSKNDVIESARLITEKSQHSYIPATVDWLLTPRVGAKSVGESENLIGFGKKSAEMFVRLDTVSLREDLKITSELSRLVCEEDSRAVINWFDTQLAYKAQGKDKLAQAIRLIQSLLETSSSNEKAVENVFQMTITIGDHLLKALLSDASNYRNLISLIAKLKTNWNTNLDSIKNWARNAQFQTTLCYLKEFENSENTRKKTIAVKLELETIKALKNALENNKLPPDAPMLHGTITWARAHNLELQARNWLRRKLKKPISFAQVQNTFSHRVWGSNTGHQRVFYHHMLSQYADISPDSLKKWGEKSLKELSDNERKWALPGLQSLQKWQGDDDTDSWGE